MSQRKREYGEAATFPIDKLHAPAVDITAILNQMGNSHAAPSYEVAESDEYENSDEDDEMVAGTDDMDNRRYDDSEEEEVGDETTQQPTHVRELISDLRHFSEEEDKYMYFITDDYEESISVLQKMRDAIPGIQQVENRFSDVSESKEMAPEECLDRSIAHAINDSNVRTLSGVLFAGPDVFVVFGVSDEHPLALLLRYQVAESDQAKKVYYFMDYETYNNEGIVVTQTGSLVPLKTHAVKLCGMCFINETEFHHLGTQVRTSLVSIERNTNSAKAAPLFV